MVQVKFKSTEMVVIFQFSSTWYHLMDLKHKSSPSSSGELRLLRQNCRLLQTMCSFDMGEAKVV